MADLRLAQAEPRPPDTELEQLRAIAALEALHALFESLPPGTEIASEHVAALLDVTSSALRSAFTPRKAPE